MRKIIYIFIISILLVSCENQEIDFPDFDYNAVYFPLQYPLRTLILGEDRIDNSRDKELKFLIGAVIGGMYENTSNWSIEYTVDEDLVENLIRTNGDTIRALPANYYSITPEDQITIPSGSFSGLLEVQLTDDFLDDPLAVTGAYVIPLRMVSSNADSILTGLPVAGVNNPDKRRVTDWDANALPKDFVLFGIKYINPYHGDYFQRGKDVTYELNGVTEVSRVVYREKYVEYDRIRALTTTGRDDCTMNGVGRRVGGKNALSLTFFENGSVEVDSVSNSPYKAFGSGAYVVDGDIWGGEAQNALFLEYQYIENNFLHKVNDTLVFRNNGVVFEENSVIVFD